MHSSIFLFHFLYKKISHNPLMGHDLQFVSTARLARSEISEDFLSNLKDFPSLCVNFKILPNRELLRKFLNFSFI